MFDPNFFDQQKFWPKNLLTQKNFDPNFFNPNIFAPKQMLTNKNFNHRFFWPKTISRQKKIWPYFSWFWTWILGPGIPDLGFGICDLGFGIQDLGLRIWNLDSSWPTDPFDQLGVAQLSQIFFIFWTKADFFTASVWSRPPGPPTVPGEFSFLFFSLLPIPPCFLCVWEFSTANLSPKSMNCLWN